MGVLKTLSWIAIFIGLVVAVLISYDHASRYISWKHLSAEVLQDKTSWYLENRAWDRSSITAVCIYIVSCEENRARLVIVEDLEAIDFDDLRRRIWNRRFDDLCRGRTSNLGLHLLREPAAEANDYWHSDQAIWSFYNNRFIPKHGRFSGRAFSQEPWERCSFEKALQRRPVNDRAPQTRPQWRLSAAFLPKRAHKKRPAPLGAGLF